MSKLATTADLVQLVNWLDFQEYLDLDHDSYRVELRDGVIKQVPPPRPVHMRVQMQLLRILRPVEAMGFCVDKEFPYRPALNFQFWVADIAVLPVSVMSLLATWKQYEVFAPPLIVEVLSPSNRESKLARQRMISMSNGTLEFWIVDADAQQIQVSTLHGVRLYDNTESIVLAAVPGVEIKVSEVFNLS
ncbi:MAG: Uma2 family endonuclease [Bryobacteraceae bacterium]|nr:Uma2 family endonuclease [Bryobacteraceae bacterium]